MILYYNSSYYIEGADHSAAGFAIRQEPPQTAHDRLRPGTRLEIH